MMTMKTWNNCIYSICINTLSNVYKYFNKCIDDLILKSLQRNLISIIFPFTTWILLLLATTCEQKIRAILNAYGKKRDKRNKEHSVKRKRYGEKLAKKIHIFVFVCVYDTHILPHSSLHFYQFIKQFAFNRSCDLNEFCSVSAVWRKWVESKWRIFDYSARNLGLNLN